MLNEIPVDPDIERLSLVQLQQRYMQRRQEARKALKSLSADGNDNCWDDAIETNLNLLTSEERRTFRLGTFGMSFLRTWTNCARWILFQRGRCPRVSGMKKEILD